MSGDQWMSTGQAARLLGVTARTIRRYVEAGDLPSSRVGDGHWRVRIPNENKATASKNPDKPDT